MKVRTKTFYLYPIAVSLAVMLSFIIQRYYSLSQECWMALAALVISQTTRGTPLRQGLILLPVIFMIAVLSPYNTAQARIIDIVLGSLIGLVCVSVFSKVKASKAFREEMLPILQELRDYLQTLTVFLQNRNKPALDQLRAKKMAITKTLAVPQGQYPEWVYEIGFNRGLRSGFRFFLIQLERAIEVAFAMEYIAFSGISSLMLDDLYSAMVVAMQRNEALIDMLITYFDKDRLLNPEFDLTEDIVELENTLSKLVPQSLELIDISRSGLLSTALVRDIRDMRDLLLQLVTSLPTKSVTRHS